MSLSVLIPPFGTLFDTNGVPLENGYVYIGEANLNPITYPVNVYFDVDLISPAAQPLRTLAGLIVRSGTPTNLYISENQYSIIVLDKNESLVYSNLSNDLTNTDNILYTPFPNAITQSLTNRLMIFVSVTDFGAVGDGSMDDTQALTNAIQYVKDQGGGVVHLPSGRYRTTTALFLLDTVSIQGDGFNASIIEYYGTGQILIDGEKIQSSVYYIDFQISNENNLNINVSGIVWNQGLSRSHIRVRYTAKGGDTSDGFVLHGTLNNDGSTPNNNQYGCLWEVYTDAVDVGGGTECNGVALKLNGANVDGARANAHEITNSKLDGFSTGLYLNGNGNAIRSITVNKASIAGIHFYGDGGCNNNLIEGAYLDSGIGVSGGKDIILESLVATTIVVAILKVLRQNTVIENVGGNAQYFDYSVRQNIIPNLPYVVDPANALASGIFGNSPESGVRLGASRDGTSGVVIVSGKDFKQIINQLAPMGSVSATLNRHGASQFRITNTENGISYDQIASIDSRTGALYIYPTPNTLSFTDVEVNPITDEITIVGHGLVTADILVFFSDTMDPGGISTNSIYRAIIIDSDTIQLATNVQNALGGTQIDITSPGSGNMTLTTGGHHGIAILAPGGSPQTFYNAAIRSQGHVTFDRGSGTGGLGLEFQWFDGRFVVSFAFGAAVGGEQIPYAIVG